MVEKIIYIDSVNVKEEEKELLKKIFDIKEKLEIDKLKIDKKSEENKNINQALKEVDSGDVALSEDSDKTILEQVTDEYRNQDSEELSKKEDEVKNKYKQTKEELEKYGMLSNLNKFIVIEKDDIEGFLEYQFDYQDESLNVKAVTLYSEKEDKNIYQKLNDLLASKIEEEAKFKATTIDYDNVISNVSSLNPVEQLDTKAVIDVLEKDDLNLQPVDKLDSETLNDLSDDQIRAITKLVESDATVDFVDVDKGIGFNHQQELISATPDGETMKIDNSLSDYVPEEPKPIIEEPAKVKKYPLYQSSKADIKKQGFVDTLIFTLLTGFCAGILTAISFLIIYIKLG